MAEKENKKDLILQSAREIFMEKGYYAATSEEIARKAGVGKGTIYQYFASKQDIFEEMQIAYLEEYCASISSCVDLEKSFAVNIRNLTHMHLSRIDLLIHLMIGDFSIAPNRLLSVKRISEEHEKMERVLQQLLLQAQEKQELRAVSLQGAIHFITGLFMGLAHQVLVVKNRAGADLELEQTKAMMEEETVELILHGLSAG